MGQEATADTGRTEQLRDILEGPEAKILAGLRAQGWQLPPKMDPAQLAATVAFLRSTLSQRTDLVVPDAQEEVRGEAAAFTAGLRTVLARPAPTKPVELSPDDPRLAQLKADFGDGLLILDTEDQAPSPEQGAERFAKMLAAKNKPKKSPLTWEEVVEKLSYTHWKNPNKTGLQLALEMANEGQLIGVDKKGRLIIRDRLPEGETVYPGMDYWETYDRVYGEENEPTGYEMFTLRGNRIYEKSSFLRAYEQFKGLFIKGKGDQELSIWLDKGRDRKKKLTSVETLDVKKTAVPDLSKLVLRPTQIIVDKSRIKIEDRLHKTGESKVHEDTSIVPNPPSEKKSNRGTVRMLRI